MELGPATKHRVVARVVPFLGAALLTGNLIVAPMLWYRSYHPDFHTIHGFAKKALEGHTLYHGPNPYLPGAVFLLAPLGLLDKPAAWLVWKFVMAGVISVTVVGVYRLSRRTLSVPLAWCCATNIGLLAGMTPKTGNPGNLVGPLVVLAWILMTTSRERIAGGVLGVALALKYPLGLPLLGLALIKGRLKCVATAVCVFAATNGIALLWLARNGDDLGGVYRAVKDGIVLVGGYNQHGYNAWFNAEVRGRYSTLSAMPLLSGMGMSPSWVRGVTLGLCMCAVVLAVYMTVRRRGTILCGLSVFSPLFLTLTYHRYYDSALLVFPIYLAWTRARASKGSLMVGRVIVLVSSLFLLRSISYTIVYRLGVSGEMLRSWCFNFVVGPIHIYALMCMAVGSFALCAYGPSDSEGEPNNNTVMHQGDP